MSDTLSSRTPRTRPRRKGHAGKVRRAAPRRLSTARCEPAALAALLKCDKQRVPGGGQVAQIPFEGIAPDQGPAAVLHGFELAVPEQPLDGRQAEAGIARGPRRAEGVGKGIHGKGPQWMDPTAPPGARCRAGGTPWRAR